MSLLFKKRRDFYFFNFAYSPLPPNISMTVDTLALCNMSSLHKNENATKRTRRHSLCISVQQIKMPSNFDSIWLRICGDIMRATIWLQQLALESSTFPTESSLHYSLHYSFGWYSDPLGVSAAHALQLEEHYRQMTTDTVLCTTDSRLLQRRYRHTTEISETTATLQAHYSTALTLQHDDSLQHGRKVQ